MKCCSLPEIQREYIVPDSVFERSSLVTAQVLSCACKSTSTQRSVQVVTLEYNSQVQCRGRSEVHMLICFHELLQVTLDLFQEVQEVEFQAHVGRQLCCAELQKQAARQASCTKQLDLVQKRCQQSIQGIALPPPEEGYVGAAISSNCTENCCVA